VKFFKTLSFSLLSAFSVSHAIASETSYGIGTAINNGLTIYFPVKTIDYLIEPSILIFSRNEKRTDDTASQKNDFDAKEIAVGVFKNTAVYDNTFIYYGAKIGYTKTKSSDTSVFLARTTEEDGYFIAPTFGAEYRLTDNFSIGLDISFKYIDTDGDETDSFNNSTNIESTDYRTETNIIARYHF